MVSLLFEERSTNSEARLLDPGSGAGAFIKGVLRWSSTTRSSLPNITGIEIDRRLALETASQFRGNTHVSVIQGDFLRSESPRKFHYIIGNPPYVSILRLDEQEKTEYKSLYRTATGRFDLYMLFFERAIEALEPGGRLVFVTPEKFTYVDSASSLRELLGDCDVRRLELLPEDSFGNRVTYPLVTVLEKSKTNRTTRIVNRVGEEKSVHIPRGGASWGPLLNGSRIDSGFGQMTDVLSAVCDRISCGVATGADRVFVFERDELPTGFSQFAWPTVAGRDLDPSRLQIETHSVMLVPYDADGTLIPLEDLGPFGKYLMEPQVSTRLWKRTCVSRKPWYAFHETPSMSQVLRPKILCKDIARRPTFWIDRSGTTMPRHSIYFIVPRDESILDSLCEYLNGKQARDWLVENCQRAANGFIRTQSNVLKRLPIPPELVTDKWRRSGEMIEARKGESRQAVLEKVA
jgi:hypothetical protein